MRLAEPATVFKYEHLKPPYVGVTGDFSDSAFFAFLWFHISAHMTLVRTVPEQHYTLVKTSSLRSPLASIHQH